MKTTISRYMKGLHGDDSYNLSEEIAVRAVFRTIRPAYLADYFNTAFFELSPDIRAQARLADIGLRFENNLALNLAAARKIRVLLDEHKILMIPAYIEIVGPEMAEIIASAILTIRNPDPRRYFLERWRNHECRAVARICRAGLVSSPPESASRYFAQPVPGPVRPAAQKDMPENLAEKRMRRPIPRISAEVSAIDGAVTHNAASVAAESALVIGGRAAGVGQNTLSAERDKPKKKSRELSTRHDRAQFKSRTDLAKTRSHALGSGVGATVDTSVRPSASGASGDTFGYEKLIALIGRHITDPQPQIRLKWVKLIGHIPEALDLDDEHKIRFISIGLEDSSLDICLEAIAQIEFLIHDQSKLAILMKLIDGKSPLLRSKEAKSVIAGLAPDIKKMIETRADLFGEKADEGSAKRDIGARTDELTLGTEPFDEPARSRVLPATDESSGRKGSQSPASGVAEKNSDDSERPKANRPEQEYPVAAGVIEASDELGRMPSSATTPGRDPAYSADDKAELAEIVEELDLPDEAIAELGKENNPSSLLIKESALAKPMPRSDNYFLRHSAVLHIKNIHAEELRFELYQTVLRHDPKDLVRQIAVEEARNLKREHVRPILRLGLEDPSWQVRSGALEYLLPFLSGTDEERKILLDCVRDSDYHIRQKADEKLSILSRNSASPR